MARHSLAMLTGILAGTLALGAAAGCSSKTPPVARPVQPPESFGAAPAPALPPAAPTPVRETPMPPPPALGEDPMASRSIDDLNRDSPFQPAFFLFDSAELSADARAILDANASILKKYPTWVITVEGHCDERGTAEYNLALGERRAGAAQDYMVSLGIQAARIRTVSYGKEFPFDPGHDESAWARNRRAHIVITGK